MVFRVAAPQNVDNMLISFDFWSQNTLNDVQMLTDRRQMVPSSRSVIRRGRNFFKQRDVTRAVRSARAAGLAIGGVEVVTKEGTTIRILAKSAETDRPADTPEGVLDQL
jgi:hypothetical protein